MSNVPAIDDPAVAAVYAAFPEPARLGLLKLRALIFEEAHHVGVGPLVETLKWGQPSYLTEKSKAGTTLRLGVPKSGGFAIYAHCQTTVISDFHAIFQMISTSKAIGRSILTTPITSPWISFRG